VGQVIRTNSWVLTGDDDPQDWNVAVAHRALCRELVDCGVHRGWDWNDYKGNKEVLDELEKSRPSRDKSLHYCD